MTSAIENRPYAGTWRLNQRQTIQHTPDALITVNGDMSVPGCPRCHGRINLQPFITGVNVDASTDAGGASANITLTIPSHHIDSFVRDARFILEPGLEIHVYLRGYFPVRDMYKGVFGQQTVTQNGATSTQTILSQYNLDGLDLENIPNYPYYPSFHGVVTNVTHSYGGGFNSATLQCSGMLHFWQYHNMATNASLFGARPTNSKMRMSLVGHTFTRMTPYEIIYKLHHDTAGAAGSVDFALSQKTNVAAQSTVTNRSLHSLNIEYWRKRFDQGLMKLRMHGVSGVQFDAAQAAFMGILSSRDIGRLLRGRFLGKDQERATGFLRSAESLGLFSDRLKGAYSYAQQSGSTKKSKAEIVMAQMHTFATDISQFGQINLFETSYTTKMDIAKEVVNTTGFEFYQDVDGDLVFKPPLYNLDTSESPIYRIEDIDIISTSQTSKEPNATYMTVKGSHWRNLKGMGMDNHWGAKGTYIDYRLVAKFGWRAGSYDTSYYNDSRTMFFSAINRMDLLNADINNASVTIPLRPEIRPGYPVYFPTLDCFYYIQSLNHAFQFGGQCTTTLQLTARRSKFYPPTDPTDTSKGIDAVKLGEMTLPPHPILVEEGNRPKYMGFPNVVLALDPEKLNPLFFLVGGDIENLNDPQTLENLVKTAQSLNLVSKVELDGQTVYRLGNSDTYFTTKLSGFRKKAQKGSRPYVVHNLKRAANEHQRIHRNQGKGTRKTALENAVKKVVREQRKAYRNYRLAAKKPKSARDPNEINKWLQEIDRLGAEIRKAQKAVQDFEKQYVADAISNNASVKVLLDLLRLTRSHYRTSNPNYPDANSAANLLDLLSDKKASFSNGNMPGSYRYYSASSPNPDDQGMKSVHFDETSPDGKTKTTQGATLQKAPLVRGFHRKTFQTATRRNITGASINPKHRPSRGILVLTNNPQKPQQVVSTSEIVTIMFSVHSVSKYYYRTRFRVRPDGKFEFPNATKKAITAYFREGLSASTTGTVSDFFIRKWNELSTWKSKGKDLTTHKVTLLTKKTLDTTGTVGSITITLPPTTATSLQGKTGIQVSGSQVTFQNRSFSSSFYFNPDWDIPTFVLINGNPKLDQVAAYFMRVWVGQASQALQKVYEPVKAAAEVAEKSKKQVDIQLADQKLKSFQTLMSAIAQILAKSLKRRKSQKVNGIHRYRVRFQRKQNMYTPVFPVSDAKGYEVIGTYQYGRGVNIDPNGVMAQLYTSDLLQFADRHAVEEYVRTLRAYGADPRKIEDKEQKLLDSLKNNPQALRELQQVINTNPKIHTLQQALRNHITSTRDLRLQVVNAGYALADLHNVVRKKPCACKSAESQLLMLAFQRSRFLQVSGENAASSKNQDPITQWAASEAERTGKVWTQHQDALRGTNQHFGTSNVLGEIVDNANRLVQNTDRGVQQARELAQRARDIGNNEE